MAQDSIFVITLWEPDLGSDITPLGTAIWKQINEFKIVEKLGEVETATITFARGAPLPLDTVLTERTVFKVQYGDPAVSWKLFRVVKIDLDTTGGRGVVVTCHAMWADLAKQIMRQTRSGGYVDLSVTLVGQTLTQVLTEVIATDHNLPSTFVLGTVEATVANEKVVTQYFAATFLQILQDLSSQILTQDGYKAEYEFVWNNGTGKYSINFYNEIGWTAAERTATVPDPTLRPIHGPNTTTTSNRLGMKYVRDNQKFFNRIIPVSGDDDNPVTIADAEFYGDTESPSGTLNFESGIRIIHKDSQFVDLYIGNDSIGFAKILTSTADASGLNAITTDGTEANMVGEWLRFAINTGGDELVYLDDRESVVTDGHGSVEMVKSFPDIAPYPNLLLRNSVVASMDTFVSGLVTGWVKIGLPTTTAETATEFFQFGAGSQKVATILDGDGIEASFTVKADTDNPYVGCWVSVKCDGVNFVRIEFEDVDGLIYPTEEQGRAESNVSELRGIALGGFQLPPGAAKIKIYAPIAGTTFYVDAVAVTQSTSAWEYRDQMGPAALFDAGVKHLAEEGGTVPPAIEGDFLDVTAFEAGTEILLGSHIQYKDIYSGTGSPIITATSRVNEIETVEGKFEGRFKKRIRLSNKRQDFTGRWRGVRRKIPLIHVPIVPVRFGIPPPLSCLLSAVKQAMYTFSDGAGGVIYNWIRDVSTSPDGRLVPDETDFTWSATDGLSKDVTGIIDYGELPIDLMGPDALTAFMVFTLVRRDIAGVSTIWKATAGVNTEFEASFTTGGLVRFSVTNEASSTVDLDSTLVVGIGEYAVICQYTGMLSHNMYNYVYTEAGGWERVTSASTGTVSGDFLTVRDLESAQGTLRFQHWMGDKQTMSNNEFLAEASCIMRWGVARGAVEEGGGSTLFNTLLMVEATNLVKLDFEGNETAKWAHTRTPTECAPAWIHTIDRYVFAEGRYLYAQDDGGGNSAQEIDSGTATQLWQCLFWVPGSQKLWASKADAAGTGELDFGYLSSLDGTWVFNTVYTTEAILDFEIASNYLITHDGSNVKVRNLDDPSQVYATQASSTTEAVTFGSPINPGALGTLSAFVVLAGVFQETDADVFSVDFWPGGFITPVNTVLDGTNFTHLQAKSLTSNGQQLFLLSQITGEEIWRIAADVLSQDNTSATSTLIYTAGAAVQGLAMMKESGAVPLAPTGFTAVADGPWAMDLAWTDASTMELGFVIQRSPNGSSGWVEIATPAAEVETYDDDGPLVNSTTYYYRLRSWNAQGSSEWIPASGTTGALPVATGTYDYLLYIYNDATNDRYIGRTTVADSGSPSDFGTNMDDTWYDRGAGKTVSGVAWYGDRIWFSDAGTGIYSMLADKTDVQLEYTPTAAIPRLAGREDWASLILLEESGGDIVLMRWNGTTFVQIVNVTDNAGSFDLGTNAGDHTLTVSGSKIILTSQTAGDSTFWYCDPSGANIGDDDFDTFTGVSFGGSDFCRCAIASDDGSYVFFSHERYVAGTDHEYLLQYDWGTWANRVEVLDYPHTFSLMVSYAMCIDPSASTAGYLYHATNKFATRAWDIDDNSSIATGGISPHRNGLCLIDSTA